MGDKARPRVAVIGASGIGKHHAKWWALEGADVCAFAGTSRESVAKTHAALENLFGFQGSGYDSIDAMLDAESPDIVDICSPPPLHYAHARAMLEAGCHVLCEKPFVYDPQLDRGTLLAQARELLDLAQAKNLRLGVCTQYSTGGRMYNEIWNEHRGDETVTFYHGHLESPAKNRAPDPVRVWVDLSPHPISVMLKAAPDGTVAWDTLRTAFEGYEASAEFDVMRPGKPPLQCVIVTRNATEPPLNVRHFRYNDFEFAVEGENNAEGIYCARIDTPCGRYLKRDMMHQLIHDFLSGHLAAQAEESLHSLDIMLRILDTAAG
ncbi:MAG: Gfo/Idh/MocA family oxidoreductase [Nitrospiraceae bacterium]|nr:Gfo/Idh/MocA family oxidoreductase [Nitrospiraceae bacterium]